MRLTASFSFLCLCLSPAGWALTPYQTEALTSTPSSTNWNTNGSPTYGSSGFNASSSSDASIISKITVPIYSPWVETNVKLNLSPGVNGGNYVLFFDATATSMAGPSSAGDYVALLFENPQWTAGVCTMTGKNVRRRNNVVDFPYSTGLSCAATNNLRVVWKGGFVVLYQSPGALYTLKWWDTIPNTLIGRPGLGGWSMPAGTGFSDVSYTQVEYNAPTAIPVSAIKTSSFPTRVDIQIPGTTDDAGGSGVAYYNLFRAVGTDWTILGELPAGAGQYSDAGVVAGSSYTYRLFVWDYHLNWTSTDFTVSTPPSGSVDPRRIGVRPTGTY